jgi:hypothetical protein
MFVQKRFYHFARGVGVKETPTPRQNRFWTEMIAGENSKIHQADILSDNQGDISRGEVVSAVSVKVPPKLLLKRLSRHHEIRPSTAAILVIEMPSVILVVPEGSVTSLHVAKKRECLIFDAHWLTVRSLC